ncbi:hypothetical protein [Pedobacter sp. R-06]|uniref:hypothetical protein n=1 Tax=Pedobacter sp. R-06 TaxID=3404051 RepID=UPI003CFA8EB3
MLKKLGYRLFKSSFNDGRPSVDIFGYYLLEKTALRNIGRPLKHVKLPGGDRFYLKDLLAA